MPLPTPRSVISSPIHMITAVPDTIVITMVRMVSGVGSGISGWNAGPQPLPENAAPVLAACTYTTAYIRPSPTADVPGVLGDLRLAGLALLPQRLQPRDDLGEHLHDDAGRDVRQDADREHGQVQQRVAAEQVQDGEDPGGARTGGSSS